MTDPVQPITDPTQRLEQLEQLAQDLQQKIRDLRVDMGLPTELPKLYTPPDLTVPDYLKTPRNGGIANNL
jgi:hypothetical protein